MIYRVATSILLVAVAILLIVQGQALAARVKHTLVSPPASTAAITGSATPRDINTNDPKSDRLIIQLSGVQSPPAGFGLHCHLASNERGLHCGELTVAGGAVDAAQDFAGTNLVGNYNTFRLSWEKPVFENSVPPAALALIQEVVYRATNTPNQVGYGVGMVAEAQLILTHAGLARAAAAANNLAEAKVHVEHVLNMLYGADDATRHRDYDGNGILENPGDGFGFLPYAANVQLKMLSAAESPGVTPHIADHAFAAAEVVGNFADAPGTWSEALFTAAAQALAAGTASEARDHAIQMENLARQILNGVDANANGSVEAIAGEGALGRPSPPCSGQPTTSPAAGSPVWSR